MSEPGPGFKEMFDEAQSHPYYWFCDAQLDFTEAVAGLCPGINDYPSGECPKEVWEKFERDLAEKAGITYRSLKFMMGGTEHLELQYMAKVAFALGKKIKITLEDI